MTTLFISTFRREYRTTGNDLQSNGSPAILTNVFRHVMKIICGNWRNLKVNLLTILITNKMKGNRTTGAQRYNNRMHKIFEDARKHHETQDKAFNELLKLVSPDGMINFVTEKLQQIKKESDAIRTT